jgi:hypothetical protein
MAKKPITLEDLREEFLAHCESRNLSGKTVEWYDDRTRRFADWCATRGIGSPGARAPATRCRALREKNARLRARVVKSLD